MIGESGWPEPNRSRSAMHDGKVVFFSAGKAAIVALDMEIKHGKRFAAYDCPWGEQGKHWHVGTPPGRDFVPGQTRES
jgi:hypothetical protein